MDVSDLAAELRRLPVRRRVGRVVRAEAASLRIAGLAPVARLGDRVGLAPAGAAGPVTGEIVALGDGLATVMTHGPADGVRLGEEAELSPDPGLRPCDAWLGRVIDPFGAPLDGRPLPQGRAEVPVRAAPPPAMKRLALGPRIATGLAVLDSLLPLTRGQRVGLFAGSGVGKTSLLAELARNVEAERVVLALIGERGRELRGFVEDALGEAGMRRSVVICATSDRPALVKRRAAWAAAAVAERFRDEGRHVLLLVDSLTRFAEAHREVALTAGEPPSLRAWPPSTAAALAALTERAGPGPARADGRRGDVTAVFTVLVQGSDMEEPVADMARGLLDGHLVLDRAIAERGRFPALDAVASVSRALPDCADADERALIAEARRLLALREEVAPMAQAGLWREGADPEGDRALRLFPALDAFCGARVAGGAEGAFARLREVLSA